LLDGDVAFETSLVLQLTLGGVVYLLGTPSGTGKTSYLGAALKMFQKQHPHRAILFIA